MKLVTTSGGPIMKVLGSVGIESKIVGVPKLWRREPWTKERRLSIITKIKEYNPDVLFILKEPYIDSFLRPIKKHCPKIKIVMWYGDQRGDTIPPLVSGRRGLLDGLLITNGSKKQIAMYKNAGIPYVGTFYHSFSTDEFKLWKTKLTKELFFGGSNFKAIKFPLSSLRTRLITSLHRKFNMVVHGGGWPFKTEKWVLRPKYAEALRVGKINIGINHYDVQRYYNRRLFESVASGRMHMTYYIPGMEMHFKNKEHLVWFKSVEECIDLVSFYLKNSKARERIAKQGRKFFIERHSWPVRVKKLKHILDTIIKQ